VGTTENPFQSEPPYAVQRLRLVSALRRKGIRDVRVLNAIGEVPREAFVPPELRDEAYEDHPLPIGEGQTISQPYVVALMTEALMLEGSERVLEIGTGSGYQTAILCTLASHVVSIERFERLAASAARRLHTLGFRNFEVHVGDGTKGWPPTAPYQACVVTAGAPAVPEPLVEQLASNGRLVIPVGDRDSQTLVRVLKQNGGFVRTDLGPVRFVPLIGEYGWPPSSEET